MTQDFKKPVIVCLCGSTRFVEYYNEYRKKFTLAGYIVLGIELVVPQSTREDPQHNDFKVKQMLDELHLRKIDLADEVFILNVDGYIGESTKRELDYARSYHKRIRFLEPIGAPNLRDPDSPCQEFLPKGTVYGAECTGDCETDGHYMCDKCVNKQPAAVGGGRDDIS